MSNIFNVTTKCNLDDSPLFVYFQFMPMPKKIKGKCLCCGKETQRSKYKYCSNVCHMEYQYQSFIKNWKDGTINGLQGLGIVSRYVKKYLRRKFGNRCCLCGWAKKNIKLGEVPLVADHIDGNWLNNTEDNLRLLCPNCDSLTSTYAGLNRGNGRKNRVLSKRAIEGRLLAITSRSNSEVE